MQIILSTFLKSEEEVKTMKPYGEWTLKISLAEVNPHMKHTILTRRFLILPEYNNELAPLDYMSDIAKFWDFEVICLRSVQNFNSESTFLFNKLFSVCEKSHWSTYYPDPKSDVWQSLFINTENRIQS
jgi:hypothetical protein